MTDKMVEITVEVLGILATATKEMKQNQASESVFRYTLLRTHVSSEKFVKRIAGRTDLEDGLKKLDTLTNEELVMAMAQLLKITHNIDNKVTGIGDGIRDVDEKVQVVRDNVKAVDDIAHTIAAGENSMFSWSPASSLTSCYLDGKEVKATTTKVESIVQIMAEDVDDVKCSYHSCLRWQSSM